MIGHEEVDLFEEFLEIGVLVQGGVCLVELVERPEVVLDFGSDETAPVDFERLLGLVMELLLFRLKYGGHHW